MELAVMAVSLFDRSWEEALDTIASHGVRLVEPCGGGHIPKLHYDPVALAADPDALSRFKETIDERGLAICAFGCHGNPLHPDPEHRRAVHEDFVATCRIAGRLGVPRVDLLAGCPAGGPDDKCPNWIINSIYPTFKSAYRWQWEQCVIPYWREAAKVAEDLGVKICVEPLGGDVVYNVQTFRRLRDAIGPTIGVNFDPSHFFWQGVDVIGAIEELGEAISFVHAKDVSINTRLLGRNGLLPAVDYDDWDARSWVPRAIGYGHGESFWRDFVIALRRAGYDGPLSIEIEEPYMTTDDALAKSVALMKTVMPAEPAPTTSWFENYDWQTTGGE